MADKTQEKKVKPRKKKKSGCLVKLFTLFFLLLIACIGVIYYAYSKKIITIDKVIKAIKTTPIGEYLPQQNKTFLDYKSPQLQPIRQKDIPFDMSMINKTYINQELKKLIPLRVRVKKKEIPKEKLVEKASYLFLREAKYEKIRKAIHAIKNAGGKITSCIVDKETLVFVGPFYNVAQLQDFYSKLDPTYYDSVGKRITQNTYATLCIDDGRQLISLENETKNKANND